MSARSSAPERRALAVGVAAALGCGAGAPERDPAEVEQRARVMLASTPAPAAVPDCTAAALRAPSLTQRTLLELARETIPDAPERAAWINPPALDAPAARTLLDAGASVEARRRAAAELLAAPALVVFRVDMVNVPLALGVKELKRGAVGVRAIGYDRAGQATCAKVFTVRNDKATSEAAMDRSDRATVDPAVMQLLRDDLAQQLIWHVELLATGRVL